MPSDNPLSLDPWTASSWLQKAVRRGHVDHAVRAALTLYRQRRAGIWRRLMVIAYEDIGAADLALVAHVTMLGIDRSTRRPFGSDEQIVTDVVQRMATAPKDRSTDYLACAARQHPDYDGVRAQVAALSDGDKIAVALDPERSVIRRAIATWFVSGVNGDGPKALGPGALPRLLGGFDALGFPHPASSLVETAARKTREPITIMLPLVWALLRESGRPPTIESVMLPDAPLCDGVPSWVFDKHTAVGKRAITRFICENPAVERILAAHVPDFRARDVAAMACFYADAVPVARRLDWSLSRSLEAFGLETDMLKIGTPRAGIVPILDTVQANLDHLNAIRCRLFTTQAYGGRPA